MVDNAVGCGPNDASDVYSHGRGVWISCGEGILGGGGVYQLERCASGVVSNAEVVEVFGAFLTSDDLTTAWAAL